MKLLGPAPNLGLPAAPDKYDRSFMARVIDVLIQRLNNSLSKETANDSLLLLSPSGKVYQVTVSDTGVLTSTYLQG